MGKYLPALSTRFKSVLGLDLSQPLVDMAMKTVVYSGSGRSRQRKLKNVTLGQADLSESVSLPNKAHFACCQNVLLEASNEAHEAILRNVHAGLVPGGGLMLLVPSLESALHVGKALPEKMQRAMEGCDGSDASLGHVPRRGVLTQHFKKDHIDRLLRSAGFTPVSCQKLKYPWRHEFGKGDDETSVKDKAKNPPWDWLIYCTRPL